MCVEDDNVTDEYKYCEHKLMSEKLVVDNGGVVFRLGKLFGHSDLTKQNKLTEYLMTSDQVVLDDVMFNPTSLSQVLKVVNYELEYNNLNGIFNLSNDGSTSHYEYGKFIQKYFNNKLNIDRIDKHDRMFNNYGRFLMSCDKIKQFVSLTKWEDDMINYLEDMKCTV
jgi:dTDP-4-dehydrorhamnose reductase